MQEAKAKAKQEPKAKAKQSSKQLQKSDAKRCSFDPRNIPKAVQNALDGEFADWDETQKELCVVDNLNLREALTAGYQAAAELGNTRVESGFFLGYRRIYSVAFEQRAAAPSSQDDFEDYDPTTVLQNSSSSSTLQVAPGASVAVGVFADPSNVDPFNRYMTIVDPFKGFLRNAS